MNQLIPSAAAEDGKGSFSFVRMECKRKRLPVEFQETGGVSGKQKKFNHSTFCPRRFYIKVLTIYLL